MKRPEQALQRSCCAFLDIALPADAFYFHVPNGGYRSAAEAKIFAGLGVKSGVPDLVIIYRGRAFFIELKAGRGDLTVTQTGVHLLLRQAGSPVTVCRSLDELIAFLEQHDVPLRGKVAA